VEFPKIFAEFYGMIKKITDMPQNVAEFNFIHSRLNTAIEITALACAVLFTNI